MNGETYLEWVLRRIDHIASHTSQQGCRMNELRLWFMMKHSGQPTSYLIDAIDEGIKNRKLVAVRIKYGPSYNRRKNVIVAADAVSFVGEDDVRVYQATLIPKSVKLHLERAAKRTLAILAA